jgi:hypothetical protein
MDPHATAAIILLLCLALLIITYVLGIEVGRASALLSHPGYGAALQAT